jgi:peptide/nickel transport system substrate-binding protein
MKRLWRSLYLAALAGLLLSCGKGEERPLTILAPVESRTLDPHFATSTIELSALMNVFDALVVRRDDMTLGPGLAERWEVDDTRRAWTFHLRRGVRFSNGEPFEAESVRFTFGRMVNAKLQPSITVPRRIALDRVEIVDTHTVRIHTLRPVATLPTWLTNVFMLPPRYYGEKPPGEVRRKPVGSGPYELTGWPRGGDIRLKAREEWWRGRPGVRSAIWRTVPKASDRVAALEAGKADIITTISPHQGLVAARGRGNQMKAIQGGRRIYIGIRQNFDPFKDKRVRLAMNYAVDFARSPGGSSTATESGWPPS